MKRSTHRSRTTHKFSESWEQRLNLYALAASAAGVGMLALAQTAEAKIVYTPTHRVIGEDGHYNLDVNHDGITDFTLVNSYVCNSRTCFDRLNANPVVGNGVEGRETIGQKSYAYALDRGAQIGPTRPFAGKLMASRRCGSATSCLWISSSGPWRNVTNQYLGLKFQIHGKTHYGWARLSTQDVSEYAPGMTATLTGYAYETVPDKPIVAGKTSGPDEESPSGQADPAAFDAPAPQPATLGLLATGWPELPVWRRRESVGAAQ
jgi:hypothetical protein